ncbi:prolyl-tRNA synthetase associated domain-containing protein [Oharaeibacter diazotrophicus]|uniref:Ala-tRNA(Pro) hydrolase n=1 Tax=Oharaeibacter diazotrophicus TaxID=1920512 RepID=A0A4R6R7C7_9HYPH|nr:YbaK/EbsC family protein [Oharaeibacter diazotrophicus]TDP81466.1 Ala-tRNA(Pro) hydrolase [Oharaeibacter diazotrophicus]BBE73704.1 prolyl-tRNA editing protein ProX [Pleomorphomonas sp. SM30]
MPLSRDDLFAHLDRLGIAHATIEHEPLFTVEESKRLRGTIPGAHVKNLFVKDKKSRVFCVTLREEAKIDLKRLHEVIGASGRVSFCSGEQLEAMWGVKPGSVTPFGAINDTDGLVTVVLEKTMMAMDPLNFHPLVNTATTAISAADLLVFLRSTGHEPMILDLPVTE